MARPFTYAVVVVGLAIVWTIECAELQSYNVDQSKVSVSGISSGAMMATQYHVVHSSEIMGAGIIAGVPYMCSGGNIVTALGLCSTTPSLINVYSLKTITTWGVFYQNVDPTSNMANDRVYIFAGLNDVIINPGAGQKVADYYSYYMPSSHIQTVFNMHAAHGVPTLNYGVPCSQLNLNSYLNNCNYSTAFHLLNHIYGGLQEPNANTVASGQLLEFDQTEFFHLAPPATYSMDTTGFVYVPSRCSNTQHECKLHVAFHGCQMGRYRIGDEFARHAGYNEVGELNDIIIMYPQVVATPMNLMGCWDWYGYTGSMFATNKGSQIIGVHRMIAKVTG